jgi:novel protein kinase C epsilon type
LTDNNNNKFFRYPQVDLEPQGRLHVRIDLTWTRGKFCCSLEFKILFSIKSHFFFTETNTHVAQNSSRRMTGVKDQPFLNRRRGAMRRRVHQVTKFVNLFE